MHDNKQAGTGLLSLKNQKMKHEFSNSNCLHRPRQEKPILPHSDVIRLDA